MAEQVCSSCGNELPSELGQHAASLASGLVTCPHCGESVALREDGAEAASGDFQRAAAAPPGKPEAAESFSGSESIGGVADELKGKPEAR
jgi:hypothetical protein